MERTKEYATILKAVRECARTKFAWPGGYPMIVVLKDGATLCPDCARSEYPLIARATRDDGHTGWEAAGVDIHWEGPPEECAHCGDGVESAYGEPGAE